MPTLSKKRFDMVKGEQDPKRIIREAITNQHPTRLKEVFIRNMNWDDMLELRERIGNIVIEPGSYRTVFAWLSHDDPEIARAAGILALWISDLRFQVELFNYLTGIETPKIPFTVDYNSAEKEFNIEMPGVPGWGISYYGRDNPSVDLLLHALKRVHNRIHSDTTPRSPKEGIH